MSRVIHDATYDMTLLHASLKAICERLHVMQTSVPVRKRNDLPALLWRNPLSALSSELLRYVELNP